MIDTEYEEIFGAWEAVNSDSRTDFPEIKVADDFSEIEVTDLHQEQFRRDTNRAWLREWFNRVERYVLDGENNQDLLTPLLKLTSNSLEALMEALSPLVLNPQEERDE